MVQGIGIDLVDLVEFRRLCDDCRDPSAPEANAFVRHTFSEAERRQAAGRHDPMEYLAGRFAVKEAVLKAVVHLMTPDGFDMRLITSLDDANGRPYVVMEGRLAEILVQAGVSDVQISISNENEYVVAIALAQ